MVNVFVASNMATDYPRKLLTPNRQSPSVRQGAETIIVDSDIGVETTNSEVLSAAAKIDADYVIPCDKLHDQAATTESVHEFLRIYETHTCSATPLIPLQLPYHEHYEQLPNHSHYCLGGMVKPRMNADSVMREIRQFRAVEPDAYVHALGVGGGIELIRRLSGSELIDSVDCATPEIAASNGEALNQQLQRMEIVIKNGNGVRKRTTPLAEFNSYQIQDAWDREANSIQQTLTDSCEDRPPVSDPDAQPSQHHTLTTPTASDIHGVREMDNDD